MKTSPRSPIRTPVSQVTAPCCPARLVSTSCTMEYACGSKRPILRAVPPALAVVASAAGMPPSCAGAQSAHSPALSLPSTVCCSGLHMQLTWRGVSAAPGVSSTTHRRSCRRQRVRVGYVLRFTIPRAGYVCPRSCGIHKYHWALPGRSKAGRLEVSVIQMHVR